MSTVDIRRWILIAAVLSGALSIAACGKTTREHNVNEWLKALHHSGTDLGIFGFWPHPKTVYYVRGSRWWQPSWIEVGSLHGYIAQVLKLQDAVAFTNEAGAWIVRRGETRAQSVSQLFHCTGKDARFLGRPNVEFEPSGDRADCIRCLTTVEDPSVGGFSPQQRCTRAEVTSFDLFGKQLSTHLLALEPEPGCHFLGLTYKNGIRSVSRCEIAGTYFCMHVDEQDKVVLREPEGRPSRDCRSIGGTQAPPNFEDL